MDEKEQYLLEDKDLLEQLDAPTTGAPVKASERMQELASLQIKAILRNRKTAHDLDASTKKYSFALIAFAIAQLVLGIFQFLFEAEFSGHEWVGLFYVVAAIILIVYVVVTATKDISKE